MSDLKVENKGFITKSLIVIVIISIVYFLLIASNLVRVLNDDTCSSESVNNFNNRVFFNSSYNITSDVVELQEYSFIKDHQELYICVGGYSENGNSLNLINGESDVIGSLIVPSGNFQECGLVSVVNPSSFYGFSCVDCNETSFLNVGREITGDKVLVNSNEFIGYDYPSNIELLVGYGCVSKIKFFSIVYFCFLGFMLGLALVVIGFAKIEEIILRGLE